MASVSLTSYPKRGNLMADDGPRPAQFCYLHVHTPYGPGGGPGSLAEYAAAAAAAGYPALACSDYGSVAAWPDWALDRLAGHLPRPEQLLCGLPCDEADQVYLAKLAAEADLPLLALPTVRYPAPAHAPVHALLRAAQDPAANAAPPLTELALDATQN